VAAAEAASEAVRPPRRWPLRFASAPRGRAVPAAAAPAPGWCWGFGCRLGPVSPSLTLAPHPALTKPRTRPW
jgi:hypothetical protein